ncbi:MAG: twin-arginine translocation signal domain-containing protein [Dehalococcoidia bacterium]|nr:twin-arginine translocation signal domain-containing protein [Dehalococcoidia bacterium]MCA9852209.1 twin-arginine translocation signal domain-containing protein [Dehalococcoidia bacterium]
MARQPSRRRFIAGIAAALGTAALGISWPNKTPLRAQSSEPDYGPLAERYGRFLLLSSEAPEPDAFEGFTVARRSRGSGPLVPSSRVLASSDLAEELRQPVYELLNPPQELEPSGLQVLRHASGEFFSGSVGYSVRDNGAAHAHAIGVSIEGPYSGDLHIVRGDGTPRTPPELPAKLDGLPSGAVGHVWEDGFAAFWVEGAYRYSISSQFYSMPRLLAGGDAIPLRRIVP